VAAEPQGPFDNLSAITRRTVIGTYRLSRSRVRRRCLQAAVRRSQTWRLKAGISKGL
jgi:hypothetical protein